MTTQTDERVCECGCGQSMAGRSEKARFYADRCRAKMHHERRRANSDNPGPRKPKKQAPQEPKGRTPKQARPTPPKAQKKPSVRPHSAGDSQSEDDPRRFVVGEPEAIDKDTWAKIEEQSGHKGTRVTDRDVTEYHNNLICYALCEAESVCKLCRRRGGGDPAKGGAGPLKTKMGQRGAWCEDCWPQAFPGEEF